MAKKAAAPKKHRARASVFTKLLILALLAGIGFQLYRLQGQVDAAQAERDALQSRVQTQQQENDGLFNDIEEGTTPEKMEEIAREELGMVTPGERVYYDTSN